MTVLEQKYWHTVNTLFKIRLDMATLTLRVALFFVSGDSTKSHCKQTNMPNYVKSGWKNKECGFWLWSETWCHDIILVKPDGAKLYFCFSTINF